MAIGARNVVEDNHEELVTLALSTGPRPAHPPPPSQNQNGVIQPSQQYVSMAGLPPPPPPPPSRHLFSTPSPQPDHRHHHPYESGPTPTTPASRNGRARRSTVRIGQGKSETIVAPYPWATTRRAVTHPLNHILANGVTEISGDVHCKHCDHTFEIRYDLKQKFADVSAFVRENKEEMRDRAPPEWMNPVLPDCSQCEQSNCVKPVLGKKRSINWLFLFLGQMIGCCRLSELKYFCKHTKNHRTGAKDRVLYLAYVGICKQLDPDGPFDP